MSVRLALCASFASLASFAMFACSRQPCPTATEDQGPVVRLDRSYGTCNFAPEAHIARAGRAMKHQVVQLDGATSVDLNDDHLSFKWSFQEKPRGSQAALTGETQAKASFTPDVGGDYFVVLEVSDGELSSTPEQVDVRVTNQIPIAAAGADIVSPLGAQVTLDATGSSDGDGDPLTYAWSIKTHPSGSTARFDDPASAVPHFTPDLYGVYQLALVVNDGENDSPEDIVRIGGGITGLPPVANAGADVNAILGKRIRLDGTASADPEGHALTYAWSIDSQPANSLSNGSIVDATLAEPEFLPAKEGTYTLSLIVNDGFYDSPSDTVEVLTVPGTGMIGGPCEPDGCPMFSVCENDICVPRGGCGEKTQAGSDMPETHTFELGQTSGMFDFTYDTFFQEDRIKVKYEGRVIFDTGCVGMMDTRTISYSGSSTSVTVEVTPNCMGGTGTSWEFTVGCPK